MLGNTMHMAQNPSQFVKILYGSSALVSCGLSIAYIAIGALYLDDCPISPNIPIYLIVLGLFNIVMWALVYLPWAPKPEDGPTTTGRILSLFFFMVSFFLFIWLITGSYWIYSIYEPNYNSSFPESESIPYCNKLLYLFAFGITTTMYVALAILIVYTCTTLCCLLGGCCTPQITTINVNNA